jgi:hypothetical protein
MPRLTSEEKIAAIQKKLSDNSAAQARLRRELRAMRTGQKKQTRKQRAHAAIVLGLGMAEHASRNPGSEVRRIAIRILEHYLEQKPAGDPPVAELLAQLQGAPSSPADDAGKLPGEAPIETEAESISDAAE